MDVSDRGRIGVVRAAVGALNGGDVDGYLAHFEPSCLRWLAGFEQPLPLAEVEGSLRQLSAAFNPLRLEEEALFGSDDLVCARWVLRGMHVNDYLGIPASRREIAVQSCEVYELRRERIVTVWTYQDPLELLRQIEGA